MNILIAPNSFKHSLNTFEIAEAIKQGFSQSKLKATYTLFPIADGGEGITDILVRYFKGSLYQTNVLDALGREIQTSFGIIDSGKTAIIELARASGIKWLKKEELNPMQTSTYGTGQLLLKALDLGIRNFLVGLGNSATVDGGIGLLQALGIRFLNADRNDIKNWAQDIHKISRIDTTGLDPRIKASTIIIACDVENPLLGESGSARVFGPQKGADPEMVEVLEKGLSHLNNLTLKFIGKDLAGIKYGGAAGGVAAFLSGFLNAKLVPGAEYVAELTGIAKALDTIDLVITAEGGLDAQTIAGKAPYAIGKLAYQKNIPVIALAGQIPVDLNLTSFEYFNAVLPIASGPGNLETAIENTYKNLFRTAQQLGNILALKYSQ